MVIVKDSDTCVLSGSGGLPCDSAACCTSPPPVASPEALTASSCCELQADPPSCVCFGMRLFTFSEECLVRSMAAMYGFSAQCTSVGTTYFARLAARDKVCTLPLTSRQMYSPYCITGIVSSHQVSFSHASLLAGEHVSATMTCTDEFSGR